MFYNKTIHQLEERIRRLEQQAIDREHRMQAQLRLASRAGVALANGWPITPPTFSADETQLQLPANALVDALTNIPNLLILDVRPDDQWNSAHMPQAKHIAHEHVAARLPEMPDRARPIAVLSQNGSYAEPICEIMQRAGFTNLLLVSGGMDAYTGPLAKSELAPLDLAHVQGTDRALIARIAQLLDSDVRPGLKRDGGDLELLAVESGIVKVRMVGACHGCGMQSRTVQQGITTYLKHMFPEVTGVEDLTG